MSTPWLALALPAIEVLGDQDQVRLLETLGRLEYVSYHELQDALDLSRSVVEKRLRRLRTAGLASQSRDGQKTYFVPTPLGRQWLQFLREAYAG